MTAGTIASRRIGVSHSDPAKLRDDFPILSQKVGGRPLVYLDNAATSQKPRSVIEAVAGFYREDNANIHRGVHLLSERATERYEGAREKVRRFIGARLSREVVFVRGATEAINLVAQSFARRLLRAGDEIVVSAMEHHANIVPWQMVADEKGASLRVIPVDDNGNLADVARIISPRTRLVAVTHVSNVLGTVNPVRHIVETAHRHGVPVLLDGAQAVPHMRLDVADLDCDFYVFSGHKLFGPTGIGVLYGKETLLEEMPPYQGGGDMIRTVSFEKTTYNELPWKFEAGTPHIAGAIGLGAAIDYLEGVGLENIAAHEQDLTIHAVDSLSKVDGLLLIGRPRERVGVISFVMVGIHPHDIGTILDSEGIAIRSGHHCAMPLMTRLGLPATARASIAFYNTREEIDALVAGLEKVKRMFAGNTKSGGQRTSEMALAKAPDERDTRRT